MLFTITFVAKILAIRAEINDMKYCVKELKKTKNQCPSENEISDRKVI